MMKMFVEKDRAINYLVAAIDKVHPKEDYDILYGMDGRKSDRNDFTLILRYRNVKISNSFEMEHEIGDFIVKSIGKHTFITSDSQIKVKMLGAIYGVRMSFTPADAAKNYQHSHLSSTMTNFGSFCTGVESYSSGEGYASEIDLQSHVFKLDQFLRWESLEGGPHMKMEEINIHGKQVRILQTTVNKSREVSDNYINFMINAINSTEKKFDVFADCFDLIANGNGELKFVVDYNMFFDKFMEVFDNDRISQIHSALGETLYTYKPTTRSFHRISDLDMTRSDKVIAKARHNMCNLNSVYINGKYLKPHLTTLNADNILEGIRFCPEPNFMKEIAQIILFKLTDKLEKHGNSSTNEGEEERPSAI